MKKIILLAISLFTFAPSFGQQDSVCYVDHLASISERSSNVDIIDMKLKHLFLLDVRCVVPKISYERIKNVNADKVWDVVFNMPNDENNKNGYAAYDIYSESYMFRSVKGVDSGYVQIIGDTTKLLNYLFDVLYFYIINNDFRKDNNMSIEDGRFKNYFMFKPEEE